MELTPYVEALRADLEAAAAAGTEEARATARLLGGALDAALRLCLVDALSAMAAEVTDAGDVEVEIRMHGRDPEVVVTATSPEGSAAPAFDDDDDGGAAARLTLRLPGSLKERAEEHAAAEGLSVNAWIVRAVSAALRPDRGWSGPRRTTGFARS